MTAASSHNRKRPRSYWSCGCAGRPWFEIEKEATALGLVHFSSNYELYASMSIRFSATLRHFAPRVEVYSIDESFLDLTGVRRDFNALGWQIKNTVHQWTGLGIGVGIGYTKTLAKLANHCAKRVEGFNGVCDLTSMPVSEQKRIFETMPISKVWGIGSRLEARLNKLGINDVWHLKNVSPRRARDEFGVLLERTIKELNGEPWVEFEEQQPEAKQVMSSRSFGQRIDNYQDMREAITFHATNAAQRMRKKGLYAGAVYDLSSCSLRSL